MIDMSIYALINVSTGIVENTMLWDGTAESGWSPPDGYIAIQMDEASIGWSYIDGEFFAPEPDPIPGTTNEELARIARLDRYDRLRSIYDPGIMMALRALRMASTPEKKAYAEGKVSELDIYAEDLLSIPDQPGFPQTIVWPIAPTK